MSQIVTTTLLMVTKARLMRTHWTIYIYIYITKLYVMSYRKIHSLYRQYTVWYLLPSTDLNFQKIHTKDNCYLAACTVAVVVVCLFLVQALMFLVQALMVLVQALMVMVNYWRKLTNFLISHSRFRMQSSFLLRQRCAAIRFLLRRLTSWINSSCSEVSLCIFTNIWKSFRGRFVIWSTGKGSFTWRGKKKTDGSSLLFRINYTGWRLAMW